MGDSVVEESKDRRLPVEDIFLILVAFKEQSSDAWLGSYNLVDILLFAPSTKRSPPCSISSPATPSLKELKLPNSATSSSMSSESLSTSSSSSPCDSIGIAMNSCTV
ncbi:hypothetical protein NC651_034411 [Populus alba x Populus x berolinensis]|nr:hypothetical protein NC651_034411 [Populus alba x Populus x berolinensis]